MRETMTVKEFSERTGIPLISIYRSIQRGEIPHFRLGARIWIPAQAVDKLLEVGR